MTKNQTLELLNNNQLDIGLLFKRYLEYGGTIKDINIFHSTLRQYLKFVGLEGVYRYAMIDYAIHRLNSKEGRILMYY